MTKTSRPIFDPRASSVPKLVIDAIRLVHESAQELRTGYILAGATARDLVLNGIFGLAPGKATLDLDFAFTVADWQQFDALKARLEATERFEASPRIPQRMFYEPGGARLIVDMIPFGGVVRQDGTLAWPPDAETVMNVTGFSDASASAILVRVAPDLIVPVVSPAGLAVLKVLAWRDRGRRTNKDAGDLYMLLANYGEAGNEDRLYGEDLALLEQEGYAFETAGAVLLGIDVAHIVGPLAHTAIEAVLKSEKMFARLLEDMVLATISLDEDHATTCAQLLDGFRRGFMERAVHRPQT